MFLKIFNHASIALVFFSLTLLQQYGYYALKGFPIIFFSPGKYLLIYLFFLVFSFAKGTWTRFFFLSSLMILSYFQMAHLSYFGTQILPTEVYLLFTQFGEITGVVFEEVQHLLIPLLFTIIPLAVGLIFFRRLKTQYSFSFITALLIAYFLYNPIRTSITGNTWGRQPSTRELSGMNVYLSISYFLGRILPSKFSKNSLPKEKNSSLSLEITKSKYQDWDNIIVVLGESLSPHQMSLFGYGRSTTPNLEAMSSSTNFFKTFGLSSGVSTDVSVAFFINLGYGDAGGIKAAKGQHCLFRLAKSVGYSTHFLSSQNEEQLRYITPYVCSSFLDDYKSLESITPGIENPNAAIDRALLPKLSELLNSGGKRFIMLHQRGSHGPWKLRATPEAMKFTDHKTDERLNDYDNTVVEFDLFWKELSTLLEKQKSRTLVVYISDHGESLGMGGRWGHGFLDPSTFEVPIIIQSFNQPLPQRTRELARFLPSYNLGLFTAQAMGYETNQSPYSVMKDFVIYGNDIDGFAGKAAITFDEQSYKFKIIQ